MAQRKAKPTKTPGKPSEEIRTVKASYYNRFSGKTLQWDIQYVVKSDPPQGSMKKTFFSTDGKWAISFFHDPKAAVRKGIRKRMEAILGPYNPTRSSEDGGAFNNTPERAEYYRNLYCWPVATVEDSEFGFGIVSPKYPSKFLLGQNISPNPRCNEAWKGKEKKPSWFFQKSTREHLKESELGDFRSTLQICANLARSVRCLHSAGLAHSDLSENNVLVDPVTGSSIIIDIDSLVVPDVYPPEVMGTPWYFAPEVLATRDLPFGDPKKNLPNIQADLHAMAVLIYELLLLRHPLEGKKKHADDAEQDDYLMYGSEAIFVEDPVDKSNPPYELDVTIHDLGPRMENLFIRTFSNGLHEPRLRPQAIIWEEAIDATMDLLYPCENGNCEMQWFILHDFQNPRCPFCHTAVNPRKVTRMIQKSPVRGQSGQWIDCGAVNLHGVKERGGQCDGQALSRSHFYLNASMEGPDADKEAASVQREQGKLFLVNRNLPELTWGNGEPIPMGRKVELRAGQRLHASGENGMLLEIVNGT